MNINPNELSETVIELDTDNLTLAKDLAMHVAAMKPEYAYESEVDSDRFA